MAGGNPCDWDNLNSSQQSTLNESNWGGYSAAQQQEFMDVSLDAAAIGVDLSGFKVESITIAGENRAIQTAVNLKGNTEPLRGWLDDSEVFTSRADDPLVRAPGPPHLGYTGNYRQNEPWYSMQINTSTNGVQIDIDPANPAQGLFPLIGHEYQVVSNRARHGDTDPFRVREVLVDRGINMGDPCTGN